VVKRIEREGNQSPSSNVEVKNTKSFALMHTVYFHGVGQMHLYVSHFSTVSVHTKTLSTEDYKGTFLSKAVFFPWNVSSEFVCFMKLTSD
jgi:hypothetical protein